MKPNPKNNHARSVFFIALACSLVSGFLVYVWQQNTMRELKEVNRVQAGQITTLQKVEKDHAMQHGHTAP